MIWSRLSFNTDLIRNYNGTTMIWSRLSFNTDLIRIIMRRPQWSWWYSLISSVIMRILKMPSPNPKSFKIVQINHHDYHDIITWCGKDSLCVLSFLVRQLLHTGLHVHFIFFFSVFLFVFVFSYFCMCITYERKKEKC